MRENLRRHIPEQYYIDTQLPIERATKKVAFPVRLPSGHLVAAKIYRPKHLDRNEAIDYPREAREEFELYQKAQQSPLAPFVPKPIELLYDEHNDSVGLMVEWKHGEMLADYPNRKIPKEKVTALQQVVMNLPRDLWLIDDCFTEANLIWDGHQLWLAEMEPGRYRSKAAYQSVMGSIFSYLDYYCW